MLVSDIKSKAITGGYFNDPGSASGGAITDQQIIDWTNEAISDYWSRMASNEFGYFAIRQSTFPNGASTSFVPITITSGVPIYVLTNQSTTTNTTSQSIAKITKMFLRFGSAIPFNYQEILPVEFPTDRYYAQMTIFLSNWANATGNASVFQWSSDIGGLDASGNPTMRVEFSPPPSLSGTVVFDGYRYPAKVAALTDTPDLPEHLHGGLVYAVALSASVFDKAEWPEMEKKKKEFDDLHLPLERRNIQSQGPLSIKNVQW